MARECPKFGNQSKAPVVDVGSVQRGARSAPGVSSGNDRRRGATPRGGNREDARAPTRTYAMRGREDIDTPDVIVGTFSILESLIFTLIEPGSTLSYICNVVLRDKGWKLVKTESDILVSNPLGNSVIINKAFKEVPFVIGGETFHGDLLELRCNEFNVILGMDLLSRHERVMEYKAKRITLKSPNRLVKVVGNRKNCLDRVIYATLVEKMIK